LTTINASASPQPIHDRRDTLVRTIVGDFGFATGSLGTAFIMGGLSYSKLYDIDPYFIRYPQQHLMGQLRTASDVDLYIDGQRVRTLHLPAGDFDLRNITQVTGYRNVDLVIRDAFGREQRVDTSYYSSERSLKAGLHEYSYNLGAVRENFGLESNDYGPMAFAGFHRYGVTDALTLGVRAEGKSGLFNAGPTATIVLGSAGLLNIAGAVSETTATPRRARRQRSYLGRIGMRAAGAQDSQNMRRLNPASTGAVRGGGDARLHGAVWGSLSGGHRITNLTRLGPPSASLSCSRSSSPATRRLRDRVHGRSKRTQNVFAGFSYNFAGSYSLIDSYRINGKAANRSSSEGATDGEGWATSSARRE
jgi:hypothetical protein